MSSPKNRRWLSQAEAAEYIGVTARTIRTYISHGHLKAHRIRGSRTIRIERDDLDALLQPVPTVATLGGGNDAA